MTLQSASQSLHGQFHAAMGSLAQVKGDCAELSSIFAAASPGAAELEVLRELAPLLRLRGGEMAASLFEVIDGVLELAPDARQLLSEMLHARDEAVLKRALRRAAALLPGWTEEQRRGFLRDTARVVVRSEEESQFSGVLNDVVGVFQKAVPAGPEQDSLIAAFLRDTDPAVRLLAARLLDRSGQPVADEIAAALLGAEACSFLMAYLHYTRASHQDLLWLASSREAGLPLIEDLREAETGLGGPLLREVIAKLGWPKLNLGLKIRACSAITIGDSLPLYLSDSEAELLQRCSGIRRVPGAVVVVAHGGLFSQVGGRDAATPIHQFRSYNLTHADVLTDFLDVAPLTPRKVRHILEHMDKIVADFTALFAAVSEECSILPGIYENLRAHIIRELEARPGQTQLSMQLTRLVQMFEDAKSLGAVGTLHGLKRYLHQKGLQLGSKLIEAGSAQDRTVDVLTCVGGKIRNLVQQIRYSDFEPEAGSGEDGRLPMTIAMAVGAFARQALYGQKDFPSVRIFCYGNEVHYYLAFRNHPAFLRIDYSPPLRGGMIDLEYYGVSKYELDGHPDTALPAIRTFFRRLDFDIQVENSRVHARYDKERAGDLDIICEKARMLFCLSPYLMDLDWIVGSLRLSAEARHKAIEAWSGFFEHWGALPYPSFMTADRRGILQAIAAGPGGDNEIAWPGEGQYQDLFSTPPPPGFHDSLRSVFQELGIDCPPFPAPDSADLIGQERFEQLVLGPIRAALAREQVIPSKEGLTKAPSDLFQSASSPEEFAALLGSDSREIEAGVSVGHLIAPLERTLRFRTTGAVEGWNVQSAKLPLRGSGATLYVLRDPQGMIRIGFFIQDELLFRRRKKTEAVWESNRCLDSGLLASLLRRNNYVVADPTPEASLSDEAASVVTEIRRSRTQRRKFAAPEKVIRGIGASPGRAVGRVVFGTSGRAPEDLDGTVLVSPAVRPEDTIFLYHAAAIVSTGGGILSHAGLIALQFRKPSLVIDGRWHTESDGSLSLRYTSRQYREREVIASDLKVVVRENEQQSEKVLREGDLVAIDATEGIMHILGQESDVLGLNEGIRLYARAGQGMSSIPEAQQMLAIRGRRLRARHQIEKILRRMKDPALAEHAVSELLGDTLSGEESGDGERTELLRLLLANSAVGSVARGSLLLFSENLRARFRAACDRARVSIPSAPSIWEVLELRLNYLGLRNRLAGVQSVLRDCGIGGSVPDSCIGLEIDRTAEERLREICRSAAQEAAALLESENPPARLRHIWGTMTRISQLVECRPEDASLAEQIRLRISASDEKPRHDLSRRRIVFPSDGGLELARVAGTKAANLAEIERLTEPGRVPPWFAVTDYAFQEVLSSPLSGFSSSSREFPAGTSLREAIEIILTHPLLSGSQKSSAIRSLWEAISLPDELTREVVLAYRGLSTKPDLAGNHHVAIRSSGREEDTETASRAGEFETFLFISGEESVLHHLKRTWSGLWTERAIHNRELFGTGGDPAGGGVVVQRIVWSRASGVIQTVNAARREMGEMVINAGNGLGEGIVSGTVAADQITVVKDGNLENGSFRFRYVTADKRERVVFNHHAGQGTIRVETLYHQRLRPALEYAELCELVGVAARLELAYGYPLDIEFGIEEARLWILQARPVPAILGSLRETREQCPFARTDRMKSGQGGQ